MQNSTIQAFFALVQAGLWEQDVTLSQFGEVNYAEVLRFAEEQSVVGLVAAGLEHVEDVKVPKEDVLQFVGIALQIEQKNQAMNAFIAEIVEKMCKSDIYTLLVKGQGIAQCYERPLWRSCGDVDFLLSEENYKKAKFFLKRIATNVEEENKKSLHLGLVIDSWMVELHGTLRSNCLRKMDRIIDEVQNDVFYGGNVRSWMNNITPVFLPSSNNDVFFVFTHILKHFFHGGIGLRQICDWCRLLWTYRDSIDTKKLETRLKSAGITTEWKAFASLAVRYLGMPVEAMPLYSPKAYWSWKAKRIKDTILKTGNFGHNLEDLNNLEHHPLLIKKLKSFNRYFKDFRSQFVIFPKDALSVWCWVLKVGASSLLEDHNK